LERDSCLPTVVGRLSLREWTARRNLQKVDNWLGDLLTDFSLPKPLILQKMEKIMILVLNFTV